MLKRVSRLKLDRRAVIRGVGSIAIALPWLEAMGAPEVRAQASSVARRFLAVYTPGGAMQTPQNGEQRYWPSGTETAPVLSPILSPLEAIKHKLLTLRGLTMESASGEQHQGGMVALLSGAGQGPDLPYPRWPSIDQVLATQISKGKKSKASLQMAVRWATGTGQGRLSPTNSLNFEDSESAAPIAPAIDPVAIFEDLFGRAAQPDSGQGDGARLARKRSILDYVGRRYATLGARLGAADRAKLEQHLEKLREVERGLQFSLTLGGACRLPERVDTTGYDPNAALVVNPVDEDDIRRDPDTDLKIPLVGKFMMDMMVMALACDITAVGTFQWMDSEAKATFPWLGLTNHHHYYQHDGGFRPTELEKIGVWYSQQHAYLLQEMDKVEMGGHSLLDESVVFFGSELGWPESHNKNNMPFMLAGGGGGLRGGRHLDFRSNKDNLTDEGIAHNNLLVAILNLFGDPRSTYEKPPGGYCEHPIRNLV
jgi:hypothetical protein